MTLDHTSSAITIILFNDKKNKSFVHEKQFKKLLGTNSIKFSNRDEKNAGLFDHFLNALQIQSNINWNLDVNSYEKIEYMNAVIIPADVKWNEIFDSKFYGNVIGSFTLTIAETFPLIGLITDFELLSRVRASPRQWLEIAQANAKFLSEEEIIDTTVSDFNFDYLNSLCETYGLNALTQCQANVVKWIEDHRWRYVD